MIRSQFFQDEKSGFSANANQKLFKVSWKNIVSAEQNCGLSLDSPLSREEYVRLFNAMNIRRTTTFTNHKSTLLYYVRYLISHGTLPKDQEEIVSSISVSDLNIKEGNRTIYFKNLADLRHAIKETVDAGTKADAAKFDIPTAILYLAWYGLSEEEILSFPKSGVLDDCIMVNNQRIEVDPAVSRFLNGFRDSEGYMQYAKGQIFRKYVYSDYLIRTEHNDRIDLDKLRGILYRMNNILERKYSLRYDVVYQSGIFYRAYLLECNSIDFDLNDLQFASKIFCSSLDNKNKLRAKIRDYEMYKQLFS